MIWPTSDAEIISTIVLVNEGGFSNDPADAGGATRYGITIATYSAYLGRQASVEDVKNMPVSDAIAIYAKRYISDPGFNDISNLRIRTILVDTAVLFGPVRATTFMQNAVGIGADGVCGPHTAQAVNSYSDPRGVCNSMAAQRIKYHADRVEADSSQVRFLVGWVNRACSFIE